MVAMIEVSPSRSGIKVSRDELVHVAGIAGYLVLEELLNKRPATAEAYILMAGYGGDWEWFQREFPHSYKVEFLKFVRKDMGV